MAAAGADRERRELATAMWRSGERLAHAQGGARWEREYQADIAVVAARLRRHATMEALVAGYFAERGAWLAAVCRLPGGRALDAGIVEDAAYWRRRRELLSARDAGTERPPRA